MVDSNTAVGLPLVLGGIGVIASQAILPKRAITALVVSSTRSFWRSVFCVVKV